MKYVFCGSPEFAATSLNAMIKAKKNVVGVITQPDKPKGRGMKLSPCPVKILANSFNIDIYQPKKINTESTIEWLKSKDTQAIIVVAYGEFLGSKILRFCPNPPINLHPSLLPKYRGAAPIQWALINGETTSGVTTQFMTKKMDAGDIIIQEKFSIDNSDTAADLFKKIQPLCKSVLLKTLEELENGSIKAIKQDESKVTFAPLLSKNLGKIDWTQDQMTVFNLWRGLFPWPGIYTFYQKKRVKILKLKLPKSEELPMKPLTPGKICLFGQNLFVGCNDMPLQICSLQVEGKPAILPVDFANGMRGANCFSE